ncbi:MAG: SAM-dependent methyltransferase, partial [Planctomycetaceae bacterium]
MEQETRNALQKATQRIRRLLEAEFAEQLEGTFDILASGKILPQAGTHLNDRQVLTRQKLVDAIDHIRAGGRTPQEAVQQYTREAAFTFLNRFVALRMLEARGMLLECVTKGDQSAGFREFCGLAPGLAALDDGGYRLYLECLFDELSVEVKVLFDRRDSASMLWPRRAALTDLLEILRQKELADVWGQDETIGWVYQYYNDEAERKQMRAESAAPRNSRELAVRNQFFTPRYVVEFLTDNTLGRIWYEMTGGQTTLRDRCRYLVRRPTEIFLQPGETPPDSSTSTESTAVASLSQEELLRQPVYIPHRGLKDPREIRLLDPACGSMHFGLYAFDLLTVIYEEAWDIAGGQHAALQAQATFAPFLPFAATFADKSAFLREVPRLIIQHNIHGIDIDPRAAQIANLSIWLRAQRSWHQLGTKWSDRPRILRSNIVCAEPMPGEKSLLREFIEQQFQEDERPAFAFLLERIFDRMTLAGEAGSLLKIEEEIRTAVSEAHALAVKQSEKRQKRMFMEDEPVEPQQPTFDLRGLNDEQFWQAAEQRIYDALEAYAGRAGNSGGFQRRLFANNAAQGFAFIELCRSRYEVVLMNPPFGLPSLRSREYSAYAYAP